MIHEQGLYTSPEDGRPPVFWPEIWRTALSCFTMTQSMTIDLDFGCMETDWIMRERMNEVPSDYTWAVAVYHHSLGLMVRLQRFGVPCLHIDRFIAYAIYKNQFDTLVFFTSPEFVFRGILGDPLKELKIVPTIDRAIRRNFHDIVRYCIWRYYGQRERLLRRPVETVAYLMANNRQSMLRQVVPALVRIDNYMGLRAAVERGFLTIVQYAIEHLDPSFAQPETLSDDLIVLAAKHGHLDLVRLFKSFKARYIPVKAYRQAFSWGRMNVCEYISKRFPDYRPGEADILDACLHGHVAAIQSLPADTLMPNECMDRAVRSNNPHMVYALHKRMVGFQYTQALLDKAMHSKNSDMCLAVFDCGGFKRLPASYDIQLTRNKMRKAMKVFHSIGFRVYTERAFLEACRICYLEIIKDILELPPGQRPYIREPAWISASCSIHVSPEIERQKRIDALDYVNAKFQEFKEHPKFYCIQDEPDEDVAPPKKRPKPAEKPVAKKRPKPQ